MTNLFRNMFKNLRCFIPLEQIGKVQDYLFKNLQNGTDYDMNAPYQLELNITLELKKNWKMGIMNLKSWRNKE